MIIITSDKQIYFEFSNNIDNQPIKLNINIPFLYMESLYFFTFEKKQLAQRENFATKQAACTAWLNTNRSNEKNELKGTADYQRVQKLKRAFAFSNINQVIYKYMDDEGNIKLPESTTPTTKTGSGVGGGGEIET